MNKSVFVVGNNVKDVGRQLIMGVHFPQKTSKKTLFTINDDIHIHCTLHTTLYGIRSNTHTYSG